MKLPGGTHWWYTMILRMPNPSRHPKTGIWHLRQRPPSSLAAQMKGQVVSLPIGDRFVSVKIGAAVKVSLGTRDPSEAKALHAKAEAALHAHYDAIRKGPVPLTQREIMAIAGDAYREWAESMSDNPGLPSTWVNVQDIIMSSRDDPAFFEQWFGSTADDHISRRGCVTDAESRARVMDAIADAHEDATKSLHRKATGDYTPDPAAQRFPSWPAATPGPVSGNAITTQQLLDKWTTGRGKNLAKNTVHRYMTSFQSLIAFFGTRDVRTLTADDMWAWMVHRRDVDGVQIEVINKNDRVAVSSIFKWAMSRDGGQLLSGNPLASLERMQGVSTISEDREKTFREAEWRAILKATRSVPDNVKHPYASARRRYVPWLCAHTAARVASITALTKDDVRQEEGVWVIDLKHTKTGKARSIPLHQQVIDEGFLVYVASVKPGKPLFYSPESKHVPKSQSSPAENAANQLAMWVNSIIALPKGVSPNHAWRHTWKSRALGHVDVTFRDWIALHGPRSVARAYETPSVLLLKREAIDKFPRYELGE
jgi:integrase